MHAHPRTSPLPADAAVSWLREAAARDAAVLAAYGTGKVVGYVATVSAGEPAPFAGVLRALEPAPAEEDREGFVARLEAPARAVGVDERAVVHLPAPGRESGFQLKSYSAVSPRFAARVLERDGEALLLRGRQVFAVRAGPAPVEAPGATRLAAVRASCAAGTPAFGAVGAHANVSPRMLLEWAADGGEVLAGWVELSSASRTWLNLERCGAAAIVVPGPAGALVLRGRTEPVEGAPRAVQARLHAALAATGARGTPRVAMLRATPELLGLA